jgi:hypothetical protein
MPEPQPDETGQIPPSRFAQRLRPNTGKDKGLSLDAQQAAAEVRLATDDPMPKAERQQLCAMIGVRRTMRRDNCGND